MKSLMIDGAELQDEEEICEATGERSGPSQGRAGHGQPPSPSDGVINAISRCATWNRTYRNGLFQIKLKEAAEERERGDEDMV